MKNEKQFTKACVIGRFEPVMHNGHVSMIHKALEVAQLVYILIGSANKYPDIKNPVCASERQDCITQILDDELSKEDRQRVKIRWVNDYKYNDERWKTEVRMQMDQRRWDNIAMIGFDKDEDSYWLKEFGWTHVPVEPLMVDYLGKHVPMSSTFIRDHWLRTGIILFKNVLPKASINFLTDFTWTDSMELTKEFIRLNEERLKWDAEIEKFASYPYPDSLHGVCADSVVVCNNHILLIERKFAPGKGAWALPGGHKNSNETFRYAALRELEEEVGLKVPAKVIRGSIRGQELFDDPKRTAVFCKPTVAQYIVLQPNHDGSLPKTQAGDDAKRAFWVPLHEIKQNPQKLFDDHWDIIQHFLAL